MIGDGNHEEDENGKARGVGVVGDFGGYGRAFDRFNDDKKESSAVSLRP